MQACCWPLPLTPALSPKGEREKELQCGAALPQEETEKSGAARWGHRALPSPAYSAVGRSQDWSFLVRKICSDLISASSSDLRKWLAAACEWLRRDSNSPSAA